MNLTQANKEWRSRPDDERFTSLTDMLNFCSAARDYGHSIVLNPTAIQVSADGDDGVEIELPSVGKVAATHWAFSQLAARAEAPADYMRKLPAPLVAACLQHGLAKRQKDAGVLVQRSLYGNRLRAVTGPEYGRIWNADVVAELVDRFGDGRTGDFRVPGEFGQAVEITKQNTTLFASDRDMFVFLADEEHRVEVPNRRDGKPGSLARGFFVWNSEVGRCTFGIATFLFDYVCGNRIVWGAENYREVTIRHTLHAYDRWIGRAIPMIREFTSAAPDREAQIIENARAKTMTGEEVDKFLASRFTTKARVIGIKEAFIEDEGRPVENLWDVVTAVTAYARKFPHQDVRIAYEREAGEILALAA
jgi:hypothetical protein